MVVKAVAEKQEDGYVGRTGQRDEQLCGKTEGPKLLLQDAGFRNQTNSDSTGNRAFPITELVFLIHHCNSQGELH